MTEIVMENVRSSVMLVSCTHGQLKHFCCKLGFRESMLLHINLLTYYDLRLGSAQAQ